MDKFVGRRGKGGDKQSLTLHRGRQTQLLIVHRGITVARCAQGKTIRVTHCAQKEKQKLALCPGTASISQEKIKNCTILLLFPNVMSKEQVQLAYLYLKISLFLKVLVRHASELVTVCLGYRSTFQN